MHNAGMGRLHQLLKTQSGAQRPETDALGGIADAQHRDANTGVFAALTQGVKGIRLAVVLGDHAQARGAAVHGV